MKITDENDSLIKIIFYIDATIVLHNMLMDWNEAEDKNVAWDESVVTALTFIDDVNGAPTLEEQEVLNQAIPNGGPNDLRHQQLMQYIRETNMTRFNFSPLQEELSWDNSEGSPLDGLHISFDEDNSSNNSEIE
jgi:hypothetical protein